MAETTSERHFLTLFEHAPIALLEQDFSAIRKHFTELRNRGVQDLNKHLDERPEEVFRCIGMMKTVDVNQKTLSMFGVQTKEEMFANLDKFFRDEMSIHFRDELLALWNGKATWSGEGINYKLTGEPIDILLSWRILPESEGTWKQVLLSMEDISARKQAERQLVNSENRLRGMFENSPVSLWEEDYSQIKQYLDQLRARGVTDLTDYLGRYPEEVDDCIRKIRVLDVNQRTLDLFGAPSKQDFIANLAKVFRGEMRAHFRGELVDLWNGTLVHETEGIHYTLAGEPRFVHVHLSVFPGYENTFERVLVAIEDVTDRHKAEEYLRYLGAHDEMTKLYNRAYFQEEMNKLGKGRQFPVSIIVADLDGLKGVNDSLGHQAGDDLIRRAAEVLQAGFRREDVIARIGGDEFAVILPKTGTPTAEESIRHLCQLIELNNKYYRSPLLSISMGVSTGEKGSDLQEIMRIADDEMYRNKRIRKSRQIQTNQ